MDKCSNCRGKLEELFQIQMRWGETFTPDPMWADQITSIYKDRDETVHYCHCKKCYAKQQQADKP